MQYQNFIFSAFQKFFTLILLTGILSGTFQIAAQTKRAATTTTKKTAIVKTATSRVKEEKIDLEGLIPVFKPTDLTQKNKGSVEGGNFGVDNIPIDPNKPNELKGSRTINDTYGRSTTITWNLSRCGK